MPISGQAEIYLNFDRTQKLPPFRDPETGISSMLSMG